MNKTFRFYIFIFLAGRFLIDLATSIILYYQTETLVVGIGSLLICSIFTLFLLFGIINEEFPGYHGRQVSLIGEPVAYWFVVAFLVFFHLGMTGLMINIIYR